MRLGGRGHSGYKSDIDVVIQAMRAKPAYLGCLGSRRKTAFARGRLEQEGFTQEQIDGLHLPIGVAIEAEDPEVIAISIAAEMIHLRRTKPFPASASRIPIYGVAVK